VGDLDPVFAGVRRVLTAGGVFAFSVEATTNTGYVLQQSMRYAHSEAYLRKLAAAHGFEVLGVVPTVLREDQQRPIAGLVITLRTS
jgi:predicted TPR repeat methyltransferase